MMPDERKYYIIIIVDTNDADYRTSINTISQSKLNRIMPLIEMIKNFEPYEGTLGSPIDPYGGAPMTKITHTHNYPYFDCCRKDLGEKTVQELYNVSDEMIDEFEDLLPYCEYDFHTIKSIELLPYVKKEKLL